MTSVKEIQTRLEAHAEIIPVIYGRGALEYAREILRDCEYLDRMYFDDWAELKGYLLNGAENIQAYAYGLSLAYTIDILERMAPQKITAYKNGALETDAMDLQVVGLQRAFEAIRGLSGLEA